jgi:hypothetical protein
VETEGAVDTNIQFTPDGMRIIDLDNTRVVMIHMVHAEKFETYVCETEQRGEPRRPQQADVDNTDTLTFFLDKSDYNRLGIGSRTTKRTRTEYKLNLLVWTRKAQHRGHGGSRRAWSWTARTQQDRQEDGVAQWQGGDEGVGDKLILTCIGGRAHRETIIRTPATTARDDGDEIVQSVFSLRYLMLFCKCQTFSDKLELYIRTITR